MAENKWRVVCFINQFFAQIGGEEKADVGFGTSTSPVGVAQLFGNLLKEDCEIVGTVFCGDNYFAENTTRAVDVLQELVAEKNWAR